MKIDTLKLEVTCPMCGRDLPCEIQFSIEQAQEPYTFHSRALEGLACKIGADIAALRATLDAHKAAHLEWARNADAPIVRFVDG